MQPHFWEFEFFGDADKLAELNPVRVPIMLDLPRAKTATAEVKPLLPCSRASTPIFRISIAPPLIGTYTAAAVKRGERLACLYRDTDCKVTS
jgi:hypothetical protein